jgi:hypothetical protein
MMPDHLTTRGQLQPPDGGRPAQPAPPLFVANMRVADGCFSGVGRRPFGWAVIWLTASVLGVGRYGESVPLLLISRTNARKRAPAVRRDQSRDCGAVGADPALVPDAASLLVEWAHQQTSQRSQESTCLRAVLRWRIWVTPRKGERRGKEPSGACGQLNVC